MFVLRCPRYQQLKQPLALPMLPMAIVQCVTQLQFALTVIAVLIPKAFVVTVGMGEHTKPMALTSFPISRIGTIIFVSIRASSMPLITVPLSLVIPSQSRNAMAMARTPSAHPVSIIDFVVSGRHTLTVSMIVSPHARVHLPVFCGQCPSSVAHIVLELSYVRLQLRRIFPQSVHPALLPLSLVRGSIRVDQTPRAVVETPFKSTVVSSSCTQDQLTTALVQSRVPVTVVTTAVTAPFHPVALPSTIDKVAHVSGPGSTGPGPVARRLVVVGGTRVVAAIAQPQLGLFGTVLFFMALHSIITIPTARTLHFISEKNCYYILVIVGCIQLQSFAIHLLGATSLGFAHL